MRNKIHLHPWCIKCKNLCRDEEGWDCVYIEGVCEFEQMEEER